VNVKFWFWPEAAWNDTPPDGEATAAPLASASATSVLYSQSEKGFPAGMIN
jgi:hypothetical protein